MKNKMTTTSLKVFFTVLISLLVNSVFADTFTNPIIEQRADPWVYKHSDGQYYFTASVPEYDRIILRQASTIGGLSTAPEVTAWWKPAGGPASGFVWAPELHYVDGSWYIYFAASEASDRWDLRIYVLRNTSANPTQGNWQEMGELVVDGLGNNSSFFALDATTFEHNGQRYLIWAQKPPGGDSNLYIARMNTPWSIDINTQRMISAPTYDWERVIYNVNEGPSVLKRNGRIFVTYSASATDRNYAIGLLTANENADLLNINSWTKSPTPVFATNEATSQFGPGHSSFTTSKDGSVDILIYHARDYEFINGDSLYDPNRHTRGKAFGWNADGTPNFGKPYANGISGVAALKSDFSGKCADIFARSQELGADLTQWSCNGGNNQKFQFETVANGYFQLRALHSNQCLDVYGLSTENGANVAQWSCWAGDNQLWKKEPQGNGTFRLKNLNSQRCLDVYGWNPDNGASLKQWSCGSAAVQRWTEE
ncbi:family 43 glycosylhydrolase [Reinekea sp. G2M2-21]|uniref:family 43 glycosylhydrolase n=1 Tax=Reinekea sp. G2M2-21 TaxID=2788942 RepID=UPI0018A95296|nr:family 43 glycosylhydrolase [Reinekea sp. G2M2-21]